MTYKTDVAIIIPFMGTEPEDKKSFIKEIKNKVIPEFRKIGLLEYNILPVDEEFRYVEKYRTVEYSGKVSKGQAVRDGIEKALKEFNPRLILHIDGSGKISPEHLINMARALMETPCLACIGKRTGSYGISEERKHIEEFELHILEEHYERKLPDGQCGCWGFNSEKCSKVISLSAEGYELELDLLKELLENGIEFAYVPIKVIETGRTGFDISDHEKKLYFLIGSLKLKKWYLDGLLNNFLHKNGEKYLPEQYKEMIRRMEVPEIPKKEPIHWRENS